MKNPAIDKANQVLERLSATPSARELARRRELALAGYRLDLGAAREEGRREGREEGREEGLADALFTVLNVRGVVVPDEARARILSAEGVEIQRWLAAAARGASLEQMFDER